MEVENGLAIVKDEKGNINIVENYQNLEKIEGLKYKIEFLEKYQELIRTSRRVSINCDACIAVAGLMPLLVSSTLFMSGKYVELLLPMAISSFAIGFSAYNFYSEKYSYKFCMQYENEQLNQINEQLKPLLADSKRLIETKGYIEINKEKIFKEDLKEIRNNLMCLTYVGDNYKYYKNAFLEGALEKRLEKLNDNDYIESLKKQYYISPLGKAKIITNDNHIINARIETLREINFTDEIIDLTHKYMEQECYKRKYSM